MKGKRHLYDFTKLPKDTKPYLDSPELLTVMNVYRTPSNLGDDLLSSVYGHKNPVTFNVDGWPEEMIATAAKVAKDLGYSVEFKGRDANRKHRMLEIYNDGEDMGIFWRKLDEEGPVEFRLLKR